MKRAGFRLLALPAACLLLALVFVLPAGTAESSGGKTVRVGWYDSSFNRLDQFGRRTGYAYDYQQRIAAYTGWQYEYVEGTWPVLLEMLKAGEIDLMSDVSYTEDRAEQILYSSLPMGEESYYIYISSGNRQIRPDDLTTYNGKKFGVFKGSVQLDLFREWADQNGIEAELEELVIPEEESLRMVENGILDGYVTLDAYTEDGRMVPTIKIGHTDFYFAVSKDRHDLLDELNSALSRIQTENRYYNQELFDTYIRSAQSFALLTVDETAWLDANGPIRVGFRDDYLPFCATDTSSGKLTGALMVFFDHAADAIKNAEVKFVPRSYATTDDALSALLNGDVDCVFPVDMSPYECETMDLATSLPLMRTEMYAVIKNTDRQGASPQREMTVAVNAGNSNYEVFLKDHFPAWKARYFNGMNECFKAVRNGEADCSMITNYRIVQMESLRDRYNLSVLATGGIMDFTFAVRRGSAPLVSILNKAIDLVPVTTIDAALSAYSYPEGQGGLTDFIKDNGESVIFVITVAFIAIVLLLLQSLKNARRANEGEHLISATEMDPMTALYNKGFFFEYANRMYREDPDRPMDAIVMDVEQFHAVNAMNGRDFGDFMLRLIGGEVRAFLAEKDGIACRFDGDRFDIYCEHMEEYEYQTLLKRFQNKVDEQSRNTVVHLCMGVMPWQAGIDPSQQFDHAWSACNMARKGYKKQSRLMVYDQKLREREMQDRRLLNDLRRAVEDHEFEVHYQPKYDVQGATPVLRSAEALVRWRHPELGMIPPDQFIPLLERDGQINVVDHYVWAEAAKQIARWREMYGVTVPVSVNLSRLDVFDPELENIIEDLVKKNGLERNALKLEVTESAYTDNAEQLVVLIERLRKKGFEIEMDDFGTGYSSLNMLSSMPVDVLKMDKAFIQNLGTDEKDVHLVQLILDIAKTLNVPVVAEGVETEDQMKMLKELGCALVQGYFFSHPIPPDQFGREILGATAV